METRKLKINQLHIKEFAAILANTLKDLSPKDREFIVKNLGDTFCMDCWKINEKCCCNKI